MEDDTRSKTEALERFSKPSVESSLIDELSELLSDGSVTSRIPVEVQLRLSSIVGHMRSTESVSVQHAQADLMALFSDAQDALSSIKEDSTVYDCIRAAAERFLARKNAEVDLFVWVVKGDHWLIASAPPGDRECRFSSPWAERDGQVIHLGQPEAWKRVAVTEDARRTLASMVSVPALLGSFSLETRRVIIGVEGRGDHQLARALATLLSMGPYLSAYVSRAIEAHKNSLRLRNSLKEIEGLSRKLNQMLNLTSKLGDEPGTLDGFFEELLRAALMVVEIADYGSVSIIKGESWRFVSAVGHDIDALKSEQFHASGVIHSPQVQVVDNILSEDNTPMPAEDLERLRAASRPIKSSLVVNLPVDDRVRVNLTLDIAEESPHVFSSNSFPVFHAFAKMANGFLKLRMHAENTKNTYIRFANKLSLVAEAHDHLTGRHNYRVAQLSSLLARYDGAAPELVEDLAHFASLHDIGKLFLDREVLERRGKLSEEEYRMMQQHTLYGERLLDDPRFEVARNIALYHHEHYDGTGYPYGLKGEEIPLEAQIVALADVFDALRTRRSYKEALAPERVLRTLTYGDGRTLPSHFNPRLLKIVSEHLWEIEKQVYCTDTSSHDFDMSVPG